MAGVWVDQLGTTKVSFKVGLTGFRLNNTAGNAVIRNPGDTADANITANIVNISGEQWVLNSDSAGTGADWRITFQRPTSGMTANSTYTWPVSTGTANQVLQTDGAGVLSWASAASTASSDKIDTTSLAFGSTSPVSMFTTGAGDVIERIQVRVLTPFTGGTGATMSVGVTGTVSKYLSTSDVDLTAAAGTVFTVHPGLAAQGAESLIITYAAGGATAGSADVLVFFATPA